MTRPTTYEEFQQRVRRFRPNDLLPAIAATALRFFDRDKWSSDRVRLPWALAEAAKASIVSGNEFRNSDVTEKDIFEICVAYNNLDDPLRRRSQGLSGTLEAFIVRTEYSQFPFQISPFEEVSRIGALFEDVDELDTEIVSTEFLSETLGCTLHDYVNSGIAIAGVSQAREGFFDPTWSILWDGPNSIQAHFSMEVVSNVFDKHYLTDSVSFRETAERFQQSDPSLRQHEFNPLVGRPFVKLSDGSMVAPQSHFIFGRITPAAIYYSIVSELSKADAERFTRDIGLIFQHYVGRQLALLPNVSVIPEIFYDNDQRSVDWFVITDEDVLLIEVKSTRVSQAGRMGNEASQVRH